MATYYKYAERAASSQVNWAEIGKNLTDTLQEENKLREEKKAAIDEATRQYGLELEKSPQGDDTSLNQWGLDFAAQAQDARLLQDRLLKSGKLKLKDYTIFRQNITDGTNQAFNLLNEYNAEYKKKMERYKSTDPATASQYLEQWLMAQSESFANFKESQLYINPTNFQVNVAMKKDINGVMTMSHDPNEFTTVNALRNRIKATFDRFDSDSFVKNKVAALGEEINAYKTAASQTQAGTLGTEESIRVRDGFLEAQAAQLNEALVVPEHVSSILTDELGFYTDASGVKKKFEPSWDTPPTTGVRDPSIIYLKNENGKVVIDITEEQKEIARKHLTQKMDMMLDFKQTISTYNNPQKPSKTAAEIDAAQDLELREAGYKYWNDLRSGTMEEKVAAIQYLNGSKFLTDMNVQSVGFEAGGNGIEISFMATENTPAYVDTKWMYDKEGNELSPEDWIATGNSVLGGKVTPQQAKKFGKGAKTKQEGQEKIISQINVGGSTTTKKDAAAPATGTPATGGGAGQFNEEG